MKVGAALVGSDGEYRIWNDILSQLKEFGIVPFCYAAADDSIISLILYLSGISPDVFKGRGTRKRSLCYIKRQLRKKGILSLHGIRVPLVFCQHDLLKNQNVCFSTTVAELLSKSQKIYYRDIAISDLLRGNLSKGPYRYKKHLLISGYVDPNYLLMSLNMMDNDKYLLLKLLPVEEQPNYPQDCIRNSSRCMTVNFYYGEETGLDSSVKGEVAERIHEIYDFLFFS